MEFCGVSEKYFLLHQIQGWTVKLIYMFMYLYNIFDDAMGFVNIILLEDQNSWTTD